MKFRTILSSLFCSCAVCAWGQRTSAVDSIPHSALNEVVVTGTPVAAQTKHIPYSVTVVEDKQLQASGKGQLLSALSGSIPGLFVAERNILGFGVSTGGSGGIKIRGVGGEPTNAVLMMVDGQPQYAGLFSHHVADVYGKEYVDHVEVLRGPGSVLYGSNAMGGVINVITKQAAEDGCRTSLT
ncbi:MAG: TonB-dependent receptor plug domain-containing protein, partial [Bacteroidaceae bacterium]|nr:TonB-dependent receptor plug domain-containing protein [Bacteroidaceae bacterium]